MRALGNDPVNSFGGPPRTPRVPLPPPTPTAVARLTTEIPRVTTSVPVIRAGDPMPSSFSSGHADAPSFHPMLPSAPVLKQATVATMQPGVVIPSAGPGRKPALLGLLSQPDQPGHASRPSPQLSPASLLANNPAPGQIRRGRRKRKAIRKFVTLLVLMAIAAGGVYGYRTYVHSGPPHPAAWDARVLPYVQFVERERGLSFEHPIFIDFLTDAQYQATFRAGAAAPSEADSAAAAYHAEVLDALGFTASYNLLEDRGTIAATTTLGAYSPDDDRIVVRGDQLTPGVQTTLVHELTHALQAQHFGLKGRAGDLAVRSMAEADAMRVEDAYVAQLSDADRTAAMAGSLLGDEQQQVLDTVPWTLVELDAAPYTLGPIALQRAVAARGNTGADSLLSDPPTADQLVNPWGIQHSLGAPSAEVPEGAEVVVRDTRLSLLEATVMFDAWLPWTMTRDALASWVGGTYTSYRSQPNGPLCIALAMGEQGDGAALADTVRWWTLAMRGTITEPSVDTTSSPGDAVVRLDLCARGPGAAEPPKAIVPTTAALALELQSVPDDVRDAAAAQPYLCTARALIDDPATAPLVIQLLPTTAQQAQLDAAAKAAWDRCS